MTGAIDGDNVYGLLNTVHCLFDRHNKSYSWLWMCVQFGWSCLCWNCHKFSTDFQVLVVVIRRRWWRKWSTDSNGTLNAFCTSGCKDQKFRCPRSQCTNNCSTSCRKHNNTEVKLPNLVFIFASLLFCCLQVADSAHSLVFLWTDQTFAWNINILYVTK